MDDEHLPKPLGTFTAQDEGVVLAVDDDSGRGAEWVAGIVVVLAARHGFRGAGKGLNAAWSATTPRAGYRLPEVSYDRLIDASEAAADWLTEHYAPAGLRFDFTDDGDLVLCPRPAPDAPPQPGNQPVATKRLGKPAAAQVAPERLPPGFHRKD